jgi:integrase
MARPKNIRRRGKSWSAYVRIHGRQEWRSFRDVDYGSETAAKEAAELWLARMRLAKREGSADDFDQKREAAAKRKTPLRVFAEERWLPYVSQRVKIRTAETYETHVRVHLVPALGEFALGALNRERLDEFFSDWATAGPLFQERYGLARKREEARWLEATRVAREAEARRAAAEGRLSLYGDVARRSVRLGNSKGTLANGLTTLRAMLGCAVKWGYLDVNPARGLELPDVDASPEEMRVLDRAQVKRLLAACTPAAYPAVLTAVSTGVRRGELFGLQWRDVDREGRRLWIRRSVNRHGQIQNPKTKGSQRAIALAPSAVATLLEHRMGSRFSGAEDLIFASRTGGPIDGGNFVRREFKPALRRAGLPMVRFHDLRHTFASLLIGEGLPPKLISEQLGHASIAITMDRYGHLYDQSYADASEGIETALFGESASGLQAAAVQGLPEAADSTHPDKKGIAAPIPLRAAGGGTG